MDRLSRLFSKNLSIPVANFCPGDPFLKMDFHKRTVILNALDILDESGVGNALVYLSNNWVIDCFTPVSQIEDEIIEMIEPPYYNKKVLRYNEKCFADDLKIVEID